jgi:exonuclease VII small subunit
MKRESVDQLIERVMAAHPGSTPKASAAYFEEVHQELAPLARDLEAEVARLEEVVSEFHSHSKEATR